MSQQDLTDDMRKAIATNRKWLTALGVVLIVLGVAAIAAPFVASIAMNAWIGAFFLIGGIAQITQAFQARGWQKGLGHVLLGLVYSLGGLLMLFNPLAGLVAITLLVTAALLASGLMRIVAGLSMRPRKGWGWLVLAGVVALVAAALIYVSFPGSAFWLLGVIAGVSFVMEGWALIAVSSALADED